MSVPLTLFRTVRQRTVQGAERRAERLWPRHKGFQAAYLNGWRARRHGKTPGACPYTRNLYSGSGGTWTFAWRAAWYQGYFEGG